MMSFLYVTLYHPLIEIGMHVFNESVTLRSFRNDLEKSNIVIFFVSLQANYNTRLIGTFFATPHQYALVNSHS